MAEVILLRFCQTYLNLTNLKSVEAPLQSHVRNGQTGWDRTSPHMPQRITCASWSHNQYTPRALPKPRRIGDKTAHTDYT